MASYSESELDYAAIGRFTNVNHAFNSYWHMEKPHLGSKTFTALTKDERNLLKGRIREAEAKRTHRRKLRKYMCREGYIVERVKFQKVINARIKQIGLNVEVRCHDFDGRCYKVTELGNTIMYIASRMIAGGHYERGMAITPPFSCKYDCKNRVLDIHCAQDYQVTVNGFWTSSFQDITHDQEFRYAIDKNIMDVESAAKEILRMQSFVSNFAKLVRKV